MPTFTTSSSITPIESIFNNWPVRTYKPADLNALIALTGMTVGDLAFVADSGAMFEYRTGGWVQYTEAQFADAAARDTAYAKASGAYRVAWSAQAYLVNTRSHTVWSGTALPTPAWVVALPHAEFNATASSVVTNSVTNAGVFTIDLASSSDTTLATPGASGLITINQPGIYVISALIACWTSSAKVTAAPMAGRSFVDLTTVPSGGNLARQTIGISEDRVAVSLPNLRTLASTPLYTQFYLNPGPGYVETKVRITRLV